MKILKYLGYGAMLFVVWFLVMSVAHWDQLTTVLAMIANQLVTSVISLLVTLGGLFLILKAAFK